MNATWVEELRALHDQSFEHNWVAHLRALNGDLGAVDRRELATPAPGLPPSWFVGDIEALEPGEWVLFVGLNQARSRDDEPWHAAQGYTAQTYWDYWRLLNTNSWYARYYSPRMRLAAAALGGGIPGTREEQQEFATANMVFVELCPYSSEQFQFADEDLLRLSATDHGFRTAARIRRILIQSGRPAMVMVSGRQAITVLERADRDHLVLEDPRRYQSVSQPDKRLWHREGSYATEAYRVPVLAFPFLRTQSTHNSYAEIDQIGDRARVLVRAGRA